MGNLIKENGYFIRHPEQYAPEKKEIIALLKTDCAKTEHEDNTHSASAKLIGYIDIASGALITEPTWITWDIPEKKRGLGYRVGKNRSYRMTVLESLERERFDGSILKRGGALFVTEKPKKCRDKRLSALFREYKKPVTLTLPDGTVLTLDRKYEMFSGYFSWLGGKADIIIGCDDDDPDGKKALSQLEKIYRDGEKFDMEARKFAAKQLTETARDWAQHDCDCCCEEHEHEHEHEITEEEFAKRLSHPGIDIDGDGSFTLYYDDDGMFLGHTVAVNGTVGGDFESAIFEG